MIGAHCKVMVGTVLHNLEFYFPFEITWLVDIGWLPGVTECLRGGLISWVTVTFVRVK